MPCFKVSSVDSGGFHDNSAVLPVHVADVQSEAHLAHRDKSGEDLDKDEDVVHEIKILRILYRRHEEEWINE